MGLKNRGDRIALRTHGNEKGLTCREGRKILAQPTSIHGQIEHSQQKRLK